MKTVPCPHCGKPVSPASLLGKIARGARKEISKAEATRRRKSLIKARLQRWKIPQQTA